jgi:hypothetical protein
LGEGAGDLEDPGWEWGAGELISEEVQEKKENGGYVLSAGPPAMVMAVEMLTAVVHLYKPGVRIEPPMRPK